MSLLLMWVPQLVLASTLEGVLRERGTGDPVGKATVEVGGMQVQSDGRGRFHVDGLADTGTAELRVSALEFEMISYTVPLPVGAPIVLHLTRLPAPIEIVVEAQIDSPHASRQILDRERVEKTPGTHNDPIRLLQSLPGVSMTPEYSPSAGALAIRGAMPAESRVLFDGVELPYLYHFQQYSSVIHTRMLDELAVYPSGFGAAFGESVGGIVDVESRRPDSEKVHGGANLNAIMAGGYLQAPVGDSGFSASGRRSFMDLFEGSSDQYTLWPAFWDYLGRFDKGGDHDWHISVTAIGAGDVYGRYAGETESLDVVELTANPEVVYDRGFHGLISQLSLGGGAWSSESVVGLVRDDWWVSLESAEQRRIEDALTLRNQTTWVSSDWLSLDVGVEARMEWLQRLAETDRAWPELALEAPLLASGVAVDEVMSTLNMGAWIEPRLVFGGLRLQPGLRISGDTATGEWVPEPRLISRIRIDEHLRLAASATRSSMAPELGVLSEVTGSPDLGRTTSDQVSLGGELVVADRWEIGLDGWGRRVQDAVSIDPSVAPEAVDGWSAGIELTSRYRMRSRFFSWASLALGRSERNGQPMAYDQPFAFNLVASWDFKPGWNAGVRYRYASGLPFTPIEGGLYDGDLDRYLPLLGEPHSDRMMDYQKLDLHLERDVVFRDWTLAVYMEAWWVPTSSNGLYPVYSYDYSEREMVVGPAFVPLIGARADL